MKKLKFTCQFGITALILLINSCTKDIDYKFTIKNQTVYDIDKMIFDFGANGKNIISIKSFETTPVFSLNFDGGEYVNSIDLGYSIKTYSTVDSSYTINSGHFLSRKSLSESNVNNVIIEIVPSSNGDIFKARLQ